jgi:hypothetical protein
MFYTIDKAKHTKRTKHEKLLLLLFFLRLLEKLNI